MLARDLPWVTHSWASLTPSQGFITATFIQQRDRSEWNRVLDLPRVAGAWITRLSALGTVLRNSRRGRGKKRSPGCFAHHEEIPSLTGVYTSPRSRRAEPRALPNDDEDEEEED